MTPSVTSFARWRVVEYFGIGWLAQAVHHELDADESRALKAFPDGPLAVVDQTGRRTPAQLSWRDGQAAVWYVADLKPGDTRDYRLIPGEAPALPASLRLEPGAAEWHNPGFGMRLSWNSGEVRHDPPISLSQLPGPIQAVQGSDGIWFGAGRWQDEGGARCISVKCEIVESGPVIWKLRQAYALDSGAVLSFEYRFDAATPAVEVTVVGAVREPPLHRDVWHSAGGSRTAPTTPNIALAWEPYQPGAFEPDHAFWRPHSPSAWRGLKCAWNRQTYALRWPGTPDVVSLTAFYNWNADGAMFWSCWPEHADRRDLLVFGAVRPSRTRCSAPYQPFTVSAWHDGHTNRLAFVCPAQAGQKHFFVGLLDRRAALPQGDEFGSGVERLYCQMQCLGLDEYHHMSFDWDGIDQISFPRLMIAPGELDAVRHIFHEWDWLRERFEAHVDDRLFLTHDQPDMRIRPEARTLGSDWAGAYLVTGRETYAERAKALIAGRLDRWVRAFAAFGPTEDDLIGISLARLWRATCIAFDMVAGSSAFTPSERLDFLRRFAFVAEAASTADAWPPPESGLQRGNPNFHADYLTAKGISAALLSGHPRQQEWLSYAAGEAVQYLRRYHFASGCADEAATYQFVSLACMMLLSVALRNAGRDDLFALEPAMKRSFDYLAASQTPCDPRTGFCMLPTVGHVTGYGWCQSLQACFAWAAKATAGSDPPFSRRMMAAWRRAGSMPLSLHEFHSDLIWWQPACLIDRHLPDELDPGHGRSKLHEGLGAIFRASHPEGGEGYLLVKMGPSRGHFDPDEGSLIWYAYGKPVLADFGCQYNPNIECAWLHNRVSFDRWNEAWGHSFRVLNATIGQHADGISGEMTVRSLYRWGGWPIRETEFDFRLSAQRRDVDPLTWRRQVVYIRECEAIVLLDELSGAEPTDWNLQVLAEEARIASGSAHFTGQFGVDLDVHFSQPAEPGLAISGFEHLGFNEPRLPFYWWKAVQWAAPEGTCYGPLGERALTLRARAAPGQGYLALLLARRAGETAASVVVLPGGCGFEWSGGAMTWRAERRSDSAGMGWFVSRRGGDDQWAEMI